MSDVPDKNTFASLYSGQPPWDIGKPQKTLIDVADQITASILDAGCGTGENALVFVIVVVCFRHHREDTILVT
jgi:hypothetical protein